MKPETLTAERLRELLHYDPDTGVFTWRVSRSWRASAGSRAGTTSGNGYRCIMIFGRLFLEHRLAVLYVEGAWPPHEVDHINRRREDNRYGNLRLSSSSENRRNVGVRARNTSGVTGVSWCKCTQKWMSRIRIQKGEGGLKHLGRFESLEGAAAARKAAEQIYFGEFAPA